MQFEGADRIRFWTVKVITDESEGSGLVIDKQGRVITCSHVSDGAKNGRLSWYGVENFTVDFRTMAAGRSRDDDVAILQSKPNLFEFLRKPFRGFYDGNRPSTPTFMQRDSDVRSGELVAVCGYPEVVLEEKSRKVGKFQVPTISLGLASSLVWGNKFTIISAPIYPGNSGGPVFRSNGDVIGIVSANYPVGVISGPSVETVLPSTYGVMIPLSLVRKVASSKGVTF